MSALARSPAGRVLFSPLSDRRDSASNGPGRAAAVAGVPPGVRRRVRAHRPPPDVRFIFQPQKPGAGHKFQAEAALNAWCDLCCGFIFSGAQRCAGYAKLQYICTAAQYDLICCTHYSLCNSECGRIAQASLACRQEAISWRPAAITTNGNPRLYHCNVFGEQGEHPPPVSTIDAVIRIYHSIYGVNAAGTGGTPGDQQDLCTCRVLGRMQKSWSRKGLNDPKIADVLTRRNYITHITH